ncbi:MAG TPA: PAS domain S-box protein, partial [Polyangiaceae bacterium]|nr:PAS domain S-box protein [Polyangiaceae bacterium]
MGIFDDLFEQVPIAGYVFRSAEGAFILEQINAAGRARNPHVEVLRGKPMATLYRDQPEIVEAARRSVAEAQRLVLEQPVRRYDRTEATLNLRLTLVPLGPEHLALFLEDVPSQEVAEVALSESEARFRGLVQHSSDVLAVIDAQGFVTYVSGSIRRVLHHQPHQVVGRELR